MLRSMLGGWFDRPTQAGLITRAMAVKAARVQLDAGRDVVVPQYLGRLDFIVRLEQLARQIGAELIEIVLVADDTYAAVLTAIDRHSGAGDRGAGSTGDR